MKLTGGCKEAVIAATCALTAAVPALTGGVSAHADPAPGVAEIPEFDFSDCPELPGPRENFGAVCFDQVIVGGRIQIGDLAPAITDPIRFTYADAFNRETRERLLLVGGLRANEVPLPSRAIGLPPGETVFAVPEYAGTLE